MNKVTRNYISEKSNKILIEDIFYLQKKHDAIPRIMQQVKASSARRLQAHIDEHQKRIIAGLI